MVVLDTCALIEIYKLTPQISKSTFKKIEAGCFILSVSFAEIACKVKLGKLEISISVKTLFDELKQIENVNIIDIGAEEWLDSIDLEWEENRDPADRIITAFACKKNLSIVTTDKKIKKFYKNVIW